MLVWLALAALAGPREAAQQLVADVDATLPSHVPLPDRYHLRIDATSPVSAAENWRLDLFRGPGGARAELLYDAGLRAVAIPAAELDQVVHTGLYLFAGKAPDRSVPVVEDEPTTAARQLTVDGLVPTTAVHPVHLSVADAPRYRDFAGTWLALAAEALSRRYVVEAASPVYVTSDQLERWRDELLAAGPDAFAEEPSAHAALLAHLLADSRQRRFLDPLRRVGAHRHAATLEGYLRQDAETARGLVPTLCDSQSFLAGLAGIRPLGVEGRPALVAALQCDLPVTHALQVFAHIGELGPDTDADRAVARRLRSIDEPVYRVAGLGTRWRLTGDLSHLAELETVALRDGDSTNAGQRACWTLHEAMRTHPDYVPPIAAPEVEDTTGGITGPCDSLRKPSLRALYRHALTPPDTPLFAIGHPDPFEPDAAIAAAASRLEAFGEPGFKQYKAWVRPLYELAVCTDATELADLLARYRDRSLDEIHPSYGSRPDLSHDALHRYLVGAGDRARLAAELVATERHLSWRARVCLLDRHAQDGLSVDEVATGLFHYRDLPDADLRPAGFPWR